jgi:hypothetical protein
MSSTSAPFGFRPSYHNSGQMRPKAYTIATGWAADLFEGDPVTLASDGTVVLATSTGLRNGTIAATKILGIFAGVEYLDATGKPTISPFWVSGTTATNVVAYVYDDPETLYDVQLTNPSSGSSAQTCVGAEYNWEFSSTGGSTRTGLSNAFIATAVGTGATGQFQVTGFSHNVTDTLTDAYIVATVRLNLAQYKASVATNE